MEDTSAQSIRAPHMSNRMKHLLFGVRLSVASAPLGAADDLDELAQRLDSLRARSRDDYST